MVHVGEDLPWPCSEGTDAIEGVPSADALVILSDGGIAALAREWGGVIDRWSAARPRDEQVDESEREHSRALRGAHHEQHDDASNKAGGGMLSHNDAQSHPNTVEDPPRDVACEDVHDISHNTLSAAAMVPLEKHHARGAGVGHGAPETGHNRRRVVVMLVECPAVGDADALAARAGATVRDTHNVWCQSRQFAVVVAD